MFKKSKLLSAAIFSAASLLAFNGQADTMGTPKISAMSILNGLENPWDMAFTKKGDMFFTEKCKGFSVKTKSGAVNKLYGMKGTSGYNSAGDDLFCEGQAGMLGIAVDPNFKKIEEYMLLQLQPNTVVQVVKTTSMFVMVTSL